MKFFLFSFVSILVAVSLAAHAPKHGKLPKSGKRTLKSELKGYVEQFGGGDDGGGDDDLGDAGGGGLGGNDDDDDNLGGLGGGVGGGGPGGFRALRGLNDELVDGDTDLNGDDEVVVAGRTVVHGGAVVAPPRPRRWY